MQVCSQRSTQEFRHSNLRVEEASIWPENYVIYQESFHQLWSDTNLISFVVWYLESMLIENIDSDGAWRTGRSFFSGNDGHSVRRIGSADFVFSDDAQVIGSGRS